jgi:macrolide transport system ATP-binding/permease protein
MGFGRFFRRRSDDAELRQELITHIEHEVDENVAAGMPENEARRRAYLKLGSLSRIQEDVWEQNTLGMLENLARDVRYALRMLRRNPGFSILAILCLTLGIGANAAVFSWIEGLLFRPYPLVAHQERMFALPGTARGVTGHTAVSFPDFLDYQRSCTLCESLIAEKITGTTLSIGNRAEYATGSVVSPNYFDALGIHLFMGRSFRPEEGFGRNAHPVVVISYQLWKDRFQRDPDIIGKTQLLNSVPHTIIGVAPDGFYGTFVGYPFRFWVPTSMQATFDSTGYKLEDRDARWIEGFAFLKPGVTSQQAQEQLSAAARGLEADYPSTNRGRSVRLMPLWQTPFNGAGALLPTLEVSLAVVFLVLLIACANVSNLLLVRALARRQEMTVRLAIGAGRGRIVRQLLTEGVIMSVVAAAGGLAVAYSCRNALVLLIPIRGVPVYFPGELDWRVLALSACVGLLSTLVFALVPALQTSKLDVAGALKSDSAGAMGARGRSRLRSALVLVQVALSFILLVGAGLLLESMNRIRTASPGFAVDGVLTTGVNLFAAGYDSERAKNFLDQLMDRFQSVSGVESAAYARIPPFSFATYSEEPVTVDGYQASRDEQSNVEYNEVGPGYFATLSIPLLSGREFTRADNENAPLVAIVNEVMAAKYWRGQDPVGKRLQVKDRWMRIVGVARTAKYESFMEPPKAFFYVPLRQNFSTRVALHIRTRQSPGIIATELANAVHAIDPELAPGAVITMQEQLERSTSGPRIAVSLLGLFGTLALLLAGVGLYGVMSYAVSQSTRELGLRMALGATVPRLLRLVMSKGLALTLGGVALGAAAALALTRLLGYLLYKVSPRDPLAFAVAFAVMLLASLAASFLPAWRATRIDPVRALRSD